MQTYGIVDLELVDSINGAMFDTISLVEKGGYRKTRTLEEPTIIVGIGDEGSRVALATHRENTQHEHRLIVVKPINSNLSFSELVNTTNLRAYVDLVILKDTDTVNDINKSILDAMLYAKEWSRNG